MKKPLRRIDWFKNEQGWTKRINQPAFRMGWKIEIFEHFESHTFSKRTDKHERTSKWSWKIVILIKGVIATRRIISETLYIAAIARLSIEKRQQLQMRNKWAAIQERKSSLIISWEKRIKDLVALSLSSAKPASRKQFNLYGHFSTAKKKNLKQLVGADNGISPFFVYLSPSLRMPPRMQLSK